MAGRKISFLTESTYPDFAHACTVEDVVRVLSHIPGEDWRGLETFLFRQPTKKQRILKPVWGRMFYWADLGLPNRPSASRGPVVMLEATLLNDSYKLPASMQPDDMQEFERIKADGHAVSRAGKSFVVTTSLRSVRETQLYRTLLHEIGHWNDYLTKVEMPSEHEPDKWQRLNELYFKRPGQEREAYAHRYADEMRNKLEKLDVIPFEPLD